MTQTLSLQGKVGIITGGGSGIGAAIAKQLSAQGAHLVVADVSLQAAEGVAANVRASGGKAIAVAANVRQFPDMQRLHDKAMRAFGHIDFLVANAGIADNSSVADGDPERWRAVIETNLLGVAYAARAVLPTMRRQRSGHIVITASVSGREIYAGESIYIASKWGVVGLGQALRMEARTYGVRVTLIEPGLVDTPMSRANPFAHAWFEKGQALLPDDVANAVTYAVAQPPHMAINEIVLRPLSQEV
jgi:NADP-dependent 3-hydroxy acid dehydrogenase YdfG